MRTVDEPDETRAALVRACDQAWEELVEVCGLEYARSLHAEVLQELLADLDELGRRRLRGILAEAGVYEIRGSRVVVASSAVGRPPRGRR